MEDEEYHAGRRIMDKFGTTDNKIKTNPTSQESTNHFLRASVLYVPTRAWQQQGKESYGVNTLWTSLNSCYFLHLHFFQFWSGLYP